MTNDEMLKGEPIVDVGSIVTTCTEDKENFIFETISTFCNGVAKQTISKEFLTNAIKHEMARINQEPCEDAVSRKAVMELYQSFRPRLATLVSEFGDALAELPSIQPKWGINMKTPSDKQIKYAKSISHHLNIPLPEQFTAKAYYDFIAEHQLENRLSTIDMDLAEDTCSGMLH